MAPAADPHGINFSWLVKLRWGAVAGQVVTVLAAWRGLHVTLPLGALFLVIGLEALSNLLCALLVASGAPAREWWLVTVMAFDTLVLTALLSLTGGPFNPFGFLYLVQIALAAVVLRARFTWALVGLAMVCSAVLFAVHLDLPLSHDQHMRLHVRGMWVALAVAAAFIVYFLMRVTRALGAREADLHEVRRLAAHKERLASLATLAAGAAHELATPLSTIALVAKELSRSLEARGAETDAIADARLIREQVDRCRAILEQMALDAGQSAGESLVEVPIEEVVARSLRGLADRPPIRVEVPAALLGAKVRLPPRAVSQALRGILKNAQDASGADAEVRLSAVEEGGILRIAVADRGSGMAREILARAGEPFFTTKAPGRGMGLGLFLSRTLMERLGGRLRVESDPGRGTTVTLALPIA